MKTVDKVIYKKENKYENKPKEMSKEKKDRSFIDDCKIDSDDEEEPKKKKVKTNKEPQKNMLELKKHLNEIQDNIAF